MFWLYNQPTVQSFSSLHPQQQASQGRPTAVLHEAHNKRNESEYQKKRVLPLIDTRARIDRNEVAITP